MSDLIALWMPILVSAVVIFFASFLSWVVLPHHKPDFKKFKDEEAVLAVLREQGLEPGMYMYPFCAGPEEMKEEAFKKRYAAGPHGMVQVWSGPPRMGRNLLLCFAFYLVVSVMTAYVTVVANLQPDASFAEVFRLTGTVAVMAYALGSFPCGVWFGKTTRSMVMDALDAIVFGLLTGVVFAAM